MSFTKFKWLIVLLATITLFTNALTAPAQAVEGTCFQYNDASSCNSHSWCKWLVNTDYDPDTGESGESYGACYWNGDGNAR